MVTGSKEQNVATRQPCGAVSLNETAPHGRRELCTLSSAQPLVCFFFYRNLTIFIVNKVDQLTSVLYLMGTCRRSANQGL